MRVQFEDVDELVRVRARLRVGRAVFVQEADFIVLDAEAYALRREHTAGLPRAVGVGRDQAEVVEFAGLEAFELRGDRHRAASRSDLARRLLAGHAVVVGAVAAFVGEALFELTRADGDAARIDRAAQARGFLGHARRFAGGHGRGIAPKT